MPDIQVMGVVPDESAAEQVVGNLRLQGYQQDDISVIMVRPEAAGQLENADDQTGQGAAEVAGSAAKGAAVGGTGGLLAGLAALAIPGIGPVVGSGVLLALFGGAGAFVGGLSGAFASQDITSEVIDRYGMQLREGQAVISVRAKDAEHAKEVENFLLSQGVTQIRSFLQPVTDPTEHPGLEDVSE